MTSHQQSGDIGSSTGREIAMFETWSEHLYSSFDLTGKKEACGCCGKDFARDEVNASDVLMVYIKDESVDLALRWLRFMGSSGVRTNNFIIRQLFESCMKNGLYESAKPLLETYVNASAKVDLILYTTILAHMVRCHEEINERHLMSILSATRRKAHAFLCGLFTGPARTEETTLYFVNVLLNYLVLMGQINRARCVWKVAYENKLFPKAIVFDQHIAWSLDVRNLAVGAALIAIVHTLHRFRKCMLYYGVVPRQIKLVTGPTLTIVVAQMLSSMESSIEVMNEKMDTEVNVLQYGYICTKEYDIYAYGGLLEHLRPQSITKDCSSIDKRRRDELEQGQESTEWKKVVKTEGHGHGHDCDN
ncbi:hypothetical protein OROGR_003426 [Orobanche gracilis]